MWTGLEWRFLGVGRTVKEARRLARRRGCAYPVLLGVSHGRGGMPVLCFLYEYKGEEDAHPVHDHDPVLAANSRVCEALGLPHGGG